MCTRYIFVEKRHERVINPTTVQYTCCLGILTHGERRFILNGPLSVVAHTISS